MKNFVPLALMILLLCFSVEGSLKSKIPPHIIVIVADDLVSIILLKD